MKRRRERIPSTENDRWYERYGKDGYFCLPRTILYYLIDNIDGAAFYTYVVAASFHVEGNTTFPGEAISQRMGKDASNVNKLVRDLETLGLIKRVPLGRGFKILFQCPTRVRIKEGAAVIEAQRLEERRLTDEKKKAKNLVKQDKGDDS